MIEKDYIIENYISSRDAGEKLNIGTRRVEKLCSEGRFQGALKIGWSWLIPIAEVENFQRQKRGPKFKKTIREETQELLNEYKHNSTLE